MRYSDALKAMANEADYQATQYVWGSSPEARLYRHRAAALRALAALCERAEVHQLMEYKSTAGFNFQAHDIVAAIAAGYREGR